MWRSQISVIRNSHLPFIAQSREGCLVNSAFVRVPTCPTTTHAHKMCCNALLPLFAFCRPPDDYVVVPEAEALPHDEAAEVSFVKEQIF